MLLRFTKAVGRYRANDVAGFVSPKQVKFAEECIALGSAIEVEAVTDKDGNRTGEIVPVAPSPSSDRADGGSENGLNSMKKDELVTLAKEREVEVTREDGEDGEPTKADYVRALTEASSGTDEE